MSIKKYFYRVKKNRLNDNKRNQSKCIQIVLSNLFRSRINFNIVMVMEQDPDFMKIFLKTGR